MCWRHKGRRPNLAFYFLKTGCRPLELSPIWIITESLLKCPTTAVMWELFPHALADLFQVVLPTSVCPRFEGGWGLVGHFLCQWDYAASVLKPGHDCVNSPPCPGIGGYGFNWPMYNKPLLQWTEHNRHSINHTPVISTNIDFRWTSFIRSST